MTIKDYPPNYSQIKARFGPIRPGVVFTYGPNLYNPSGKQVSDHLMVHEQTHTGQQRDSTPKEWWDKYLTDSKFRLAQELEAYRMQYRYIKFRYNRKDRRWLLKQISQDLSSEIYGNVISRKLATELIVGEEIK